MEMKVEQLVDQKDQLEKLLIELQDGILSKLLLKYTLDYDDKMLKKDNCKDDDCCKK